MPKIKVATKNITLDAPEGENLMFFLQANGIPVASSCLADGICGKCRMVITGDISAPSALEKETLQRNKIPADQRLACQVFIKTDLEVSATYW